METLTLAGKLLELDGDGNLANRNDWNEDVAREIAAYEGIPELTQQHWAVIKFMRALKLRRTFAIHRQLKLHVQQGKDRADVLFKRGE